MNLPSFFQLSSPGELFRRFSAPQTLLNPTKASALAQLPADQVQNPAGAQRSSTLSLTNTAPATSLSHLNFISQSLNQTSSVPTVLPLPARQPQAPTGSQFLESIKGLKGAQREEAFVNQILAGNVPEHMRQFKDLALSAKGKDGQMHQATVRVLPDYLAIGSNDDYALIPLTPLSAQKIADATGSSLPTRKLVNDIYNAAQVKLSPKPKPPGAQMVSTQYYAEHNQTIQQQRQAANAQPGQLIAGHKKDVVLSNRLDEKPQRVAIYGWHQPNGKAIQPLSTVHEDTYADYSHGIRLISGTVNVDGVERPLQEVLQDPNVAPLISDEGTIRHPRVKLR